MLRFPSQLALRLIALLCILLGANTYIFLSLYRSSVRNLLAPKMGEAIAGEVRSLRGCLLLLPDQNRQAWFEQMNSDQNVTVEPLPAGFSIRDHQFPTVFLQSLQSALQRYAGDEIRINFQETPPNSILFVDFLAGNNPYRISIPSSALRANIVWPFTWLFISNAVIVFIGAGFAMWQVNRPLQRSAAALERSSNSLQEIEMPPSAPKEFKVFANRFNHLARRLADQERERALLLAGVSHDLRAPLTRIRLRAELIDDDGLGTSKGLILDAESMRHIIDQFIDYQQGITQALAAVIDLQLAVKHVVRRYAELGKAITIERAETATILADPTAVERILCNLIDNALAYGAEPVILRVAREYNHVLLEIRDHGPGIDKSQISRILQPFERLDEARSIQGHCGLGLSIVDRIIKELRGTLMLTNHLDGGLLVQATFPIHEIK